MIDILMATYNGAEYIKEQLESIMNQSVQDFRILIRDDGSKDKTVEIIEYYVEKYPEKIKYIKDDAACGSSVSNFMQLTQYATSEYIMYCDQDDYWLVDKIKITLNRMQKIEARIGKNKPILVFAEYKPVNAGLEDVDYTSNANQIAKYYLEFNRLLVQNYVTGCLMMANRALYTKMGDYHPAILMHDWWAALIASAMGEICHIPETVMLYRQHGNNVVGAVNVKSFRYRVGKFFDPGTKNAKELYERQAKLFWKRYHEQLNPEKRRQLAGFLMISQYPGKLKRIAALKRGNYLKSDFVRRLGQLWYI